jgi:hypothetical protein
MDQAIISEVAGHMHGNQLFDAARVVLRASGLKREPKTKADALEPVTTLVFGLLGLDRYEDAAKILWTPTLFSSEPYLTRVSWDSIRNSTAIMLMGGSSTGKSYGCGVFFFLDWLADPQHTTVKVVGPSEDHLQSNLFSHLVTLHRSASIPLPGRIGDLFIGLDPRNRRASISGVVIPLGRKRGAGRLQGVKRFARQKPHERFGVLSRLRVLIDEAEKVPPGIFTDLDNLTSNVEGLHGLKVAMAFNPELVGGPVYQRCEPLRGWPTFDIEKDEVWTSKRGWTIVRLDATKSENVTSGRILYPGLQTKEGLDELLRKAGGYQASNWFTFGRAAYPPQGTSFTIIPQSFLTEFKAQFFFIDKPRKVAAVDSALEGGDPAQFVLGQWGLASGVRLPPTTQFPDGRELMFKDSAGNVAPRWSLQVEKMFKLAKGDTIAVAQEIRRACRNLGVDPGWLMLDRTGNGSGVHDWLLNNWSPEVRGVNYSEGATHTKIMAEDSDWCDEAYSRIDTELWFGLRKWIEFGVLKLSEGIETEELYKQFTGRTYAAGAKSKIQSKREYKAEGNESPNEADGVTLLVHCARVASQVVPSMQLDGGTFEPEDDADDYPTRIDLTNRTDDLDHSGQRDWPQRVSFYGDID